MKEIDLCSPRYSEPIGQHVTPQYHPETGEFWGWGRGHMVYRVLPGVSIGRLINQGRIINGHGCTFYYEGDENAYIDASDWKTWGTM